MMIPPAFVHTASLSLGLIWGSFVNVLVARLPAGENVAWPSSRCPSCRRPIRKRDNIPVLSYLLLLGRCRDCRARISPRYPVIELLGGVLFLAAELKSGGFDWSLVRGWPFLTILLAVTFIDLEHRIIPDVLSLGGLAWGLTTCFLAEPLSWLDCVSGAALGFGIFYALAWGYETLARRPGLGGGDVKLLAMIGAFLGPAGVLVTIVVSSLLGSLIGVGIGLAARKGNLMSLAIPYGPFLVIGAMTYYFFGELIWLHLMIPG